MMGSRRGMLRWLWLSVVVVGLDQLTKALAEEWLPPYEPLELLPFLNLRLMYNEGAAFSFLSQAGGWQRWFFVAVGMVVTGILVAWLRGLKSGERWQALGLSLIVGGAVGNLIDRILYGRVADFIDVYVERWHWPAFNLADSAITVGVVLLLIDALREARAPRTAD